MQFFLSLHWTNHATGVGIVGPTTGKQGPVRGTGRLCRTTGLGRSSSRPHCFPFPAPAFPHTPGQNSKRPALTEPSVFFRLSATTLSEPHLQRFFPALSDSRTTSRATVGFPKCQFRIFGGSLVGRTRRNVGPSGPHISCVAKKTVRAHSPNIAGPEACMPR
jgi:hypothetical protein